MKRIGMMLFLASSLWLFAAPPLHADSTRHHRGEVSFEVLRMLSTGMSKAEVLNRAGSPQHKFKNRGTQSWIYSTSDRWIVEVVFSGNNVIRVDWSRT